MQKNLYFNFIVEILMRYSMKSLKNTDECRLPVELSDGVDAVSLPVPVHEGPDVCKQETFM